MTHFLKSILSLLIEKLLPLEYGNLVASTRELRYSPVFILGVPRSGTTLLYQLMIHHFHFAYFPNVANALYTTPILGTRFGLKCCKTYVSDFISSYGGSKGWMAPSEAGRIWNRWYPVEDIDGYNYTSAGHLDEKAKHIIYQTVAGVEEAFGAPFISKNVKHSVRVQSLTEIFPSALFIHIKRNPWDTANSILRTRKTKSDNIHSWFAVMPREIDLLRDRNYLEQICGQIFYVERNIAEDAKAVGKDRLHIIQYDGLCDNPKEELNRVSEFMHLRGAALQTKHDVPESFERSEHKRDGLNKEESMLREILVRYYGEEVDNKHE